MSRINIDIDNELNISGSGSLTTALRSLANTQQGTILKEAIDEFKEVAASYGQAIADDAKITGSERNEIILHLDRFFNLLLLFWKYLDKNPRAENFVQIHNKTQGLFLSITENRELWQIHGNLTPRMIKPLQKFSRLYYEKLLPDTEKTLNNYKQACEDNKLEDFEIKTIRQDLRQLLYHTLFLRIQLESCLINE